jgi:hypothetical protein
MTLPAEDKATILANVKLITGAGDSMNGLINYLIDKAEDTFYHYTNWSTFEVDDEGNPVLDIDGNVSYYVPSDIYRALEELVVFYLNTQGMEGYTQYKAGSLALSLTGDIPTTIKKKFNLYKQMRFF